MSKGIWSDKDSKGTKYPSLSVWFVKEIFLTSSTVVTCYLSPMILQNDLVKPSTHPLDHILLTDNIVLLIQVVMLCIHDKLLVVLLEFLEICQIGIPTLPRIHHPLGKQAQP